jgi:tRNA(fMet)-specific endonuclease VapC
LALTFDEVITSVVVAGELKAWSAKTQSARLERLIATTLVAVPVWPLAPEVADVYGDLRIKLERIGKPIGSNDLWIAAHAILLDAIVVTDNVREFARVPDLQVENWLRQ